MMINPSKTAITLASATIVNVILLMWSAFPVMEDLGTITTKLPPVVSLCFAI